MLLPKFCHQVYDYTCNYGIYNTFVSLSMCSLDHRLTTAPSFDQGLPSVANLPQFFRKHGYASPDDYEAGPFQFGHETDLESYAYWLTKPQVINNFDTFMNGGKLGNQRRWTGKSVDYLVRYALTSAEWFPTNRVIVDGYRDGPTGVMLVDVAGGRGHDIEAFRCMHLNAPGRLVLQDLPKTMEQVSNLNSKIEPCGHNFFEPQPVEGELSCPQDVWPA